MKIKLKKFFNSNILVNPEKAKILYESIKKLLVKENEIILDFKGIQATTFVFLYVLFSNLWKEYGRDLKNKLTINNAPETLINQMVYLKDNYKELQSLFLGTQKNFELAYIS